MGMSGLQCTLLMLSHGSLMTSSGFSIARYYNSSANALTSSLIADNDLSEDPLLVFPHNGFLDEGELNETLLSLVDDVIDGRDPVNGSSCQSDLSAVVNELLSMPLNRPSAGRSGARNFTIGYLTGSARLPDDQEYKRPGLLISGALTLAVDEVSDFVG